MWMSIINKSALKNHSTPKRLCQVFITIKFKKKLITNLFRSIDSAIKTRIRTAQKIKIITFGQNTILQRRASQNISCILRALDIYEKPTKGNDDEA